MNARRTCSRCNKRSDILFEYERLSAQTGIREIRLCTHCTKWALITLLQGPDSVPLFDKLFNQCNEVSLYINELKRRERELKPKPAAQPVSNNPY